MIPFLDLQAQYRSIKGELDAAVIGVLESGRYALGAEVEAFEKEFAAYCGAGIGIGVNSGTSALHLALLAAGVGPGDEVITVPFTFVATVAAIDYTGARAVLVDVDPETYTLDPECLEDAITDKTKVILPVHLYGQPADMDPIIETARRHNLVVIEDAAQAHGAEYKGRRAGSLGDLGCFSFYAGKNLGACGEGGIVVTDNADYAGRIRMLRDWGQERKYEHVLKGYNYRMDGIQGAVLRVKLRYLDEWTERRISHAGLYGELLRENGIAPPRVAAFARHVFHVYAIRCGRRDEVQSGLRKKGIDTGIHYPTPVHLLKAFADLGYQRGDFPVSEAVAAEELSLPMYPELREEQVQAVASALKECIDGGSN